MQGTKKIASNTLYLYLRLIFVLVISLFTVRIVLRALGDVDYGVYNVVCGFVSMFGFFNTSMNNGVQRFYNYEIGSRGRESIGRVFTSALYIQFALAIVLIVLIEGIGVWYINTKMVLPPDRIFAANWIFQFAIIGLLLSFLQIPYSAAVIAHERMNYFAIVGIIDAIAKLFIAFMIMRMPEKLISYGALFLCINIMNFLLYFIYARRKFKELKFESQRDKAMIKDMLVFTGWNTFGSFAYVVRWQGVNVLMNYFFGVLVNAANGLASQVSSSLSYFSGNLVLAFKPQLTQSYASRDYSRTQYLLFLMTRMSYALVFTLSIPIIFEINYILELWLGNDVPGYTVDFSILVIISVMLGCFHTPMVQVIHATGKMRPFQIVTSIVIVSILPISWLGFRMGLKPQWAYWATIMIYVVNQIAGMIVLKRQFDYSVVAYCKEVFLRSGIFSILLPILPGYIIMRMPPSFIRLCITCLVTVVMAAIFIFVIILNRSERTVVMKKIRR